MDYQLFGTVIDGRLNLRATADESSAILKQIPNGTLLRLNNYNENWYETTYGIYQGYIMRRYIELVEDDPLKMKSGTVMGGVLNLRKTPSTKSRSLTRIPSKTQILVGEAVREPGWYITSYSGYSGYVMKEYVSLNEVDLCDWKYGQVNVDKLNVRRKPKRSARLWSNVWPRNRIVLVRKATDGWYESLYRGETAYVAQEYITLLDEPVHETFVDRMLFMVTPELKRNKAVYFNGYTGEWCHRFADWLAMNAGVPSAVIPNTSNCGKGVVWFATNENSDGFCFKSEEHKKRFINKYKEVGHLAKNLTQQEIQYVPEPGDYIYFRWNGASKNVSVSHVGIVADVSEGKLSTWEGNKSNQVVNRTFILDDEQILGYGKPGYRYAA